VDKDQPASKATKEMGNPLEPGAWKLNGRQKPHDLQRQMLRQKRLEPAETEAEPKPKRHGSRKQRLEVNNEKPE
jgi:hypothetical protein